MSETIKLGDYTYRKSGDRWSQQIFPTRGFLPVSDKENDLLNALAAEREKNLPPHPDQPVYLDGIGVARFRRNEIVRFLLDDGPTDLNKIAIMPFSHQDRMQLAQLIGYSVGGYADLPYASDESCERADAVVDKLLEGDDD